MVKFVFSLSRHIIVGSKSGIRPGRRRNEDAVEEDQRTTGKYWSYTIKPTLRRALLHLQSTLKLEDNIWYAVSHYRGTFRDLYG